jgi:multidrug efflux pump subunit AcrA (membrane-fusion protein)
MKTPSKSQNRETAEKNELKEKVNSFNIANNVASYTKIRPIITILAGLGILILIGLIYYFTSVKNRRDEFATTLVTRGDIIQSIEAVGSVSSESSIALEWGSDGIVADFHLDVGDAVKKGDILMEFEESSRSPGVLEIYPALMDAQAELDKKREGGSDLPTALENLTYQEVMLIHKKEARDAWNYGGSSDYRVNSVLSLYETAEMQVWSLEAAYREVKNLGKDHPDQLEVREKLDQAINQRDVYLRALNQILGTSYNYLVKTDFIKYDLQRATVTEAWNTYQRYLNREQELHATEALLLGYESILNQAYIISPIDGTITDILTVPGGKVSEGSRAVQIDDLSNMKVDINLSQTDINKVLTGMEAIITIDALPGEEFEGYIHSIASYPSMDSDHVEYRVSVSIHDPLQLAKPGYTVLVKIITAKEVDVLMVPRDAVQQDDSMVQVTRVNTDGSMEAIRVKTGIEDAMYVQVISEELAVGDTLVLLNTGAEISESGDMMRMMMTINRGREVPGERRPNQ